MKDTFKIIAIRAPQPPDGTPAEAENKARQIQKKLGRDRSWRFFYHNYVDIQVDSNSGRGTIIYIPGYNRSLDLYHLNNIHVEINAVVGKNGTGKSSLIDLLIRTINNLSAALVGEYYVYPAAEHLHYIEYVYSDVCIEMDGLFYILSMRGRDVQLHIYESFRPMSSAFEYNRSLNILSSSTNPLEPIDSDAVLQTAILENFFYTMVCNYSMYGFNFRDYIGERTPHERITAIIRKLTKDEREERNIKENETISLEDSIWLKGLMYKNDGYQTPIVIHPMRIDGAIDINRENELSKERLLKMFFYRNSKGKYPLQTINSNLQVKALKLDLCSTDYSDLQYVTRKLRLSSRQNLYKNYRRVGEIIIKYWKNRYGILPDNREIPFKMRKQAEEYIKYKTIKIAQTYPRFKPLKLALRAATPDENKLFFELKKIHDDTTFISIKLKRTLNFLKEKIYLKEGEYSIDLLTTQIESIVKVNKNITKKHPYPQRLIVREIDAYLPPPILTCDFILSKKDCNHIEFAHLSSGEKQIAYTIGSFLYHVSNLDASWYSDDKETLHYRYLSVIFDEVEQYYHPDLQRCFVAYLLDSLSQMDFKGLRSINMLIVTHSPFVLSDIPKNRILIMNDDSSKGQMSETFGGNINDMLGNPFFMDYSVGEIARRRIEGLMRLYKSVVLNHQIQPNLDKRLSFYEGLVDLVGDKYIKGSLTRMLDEIKEQVAQQNVSVHNS